MTTSVSIQTSAQNPDFERGFIGGVDVGGYPYEYCRRICVSGQLVTVDDLLAVQVDPRIVASLNAISRCDIRRCANVLIERLGLVHLNHGGGGYSSRMRYGYDWPWSPVNTPCVLIFDQRPPVPLVVKLTAAVDAVAWTGQQRMFHVAVGEDAVAVQASRELVAAEQDSGSEGVHFGGKVVARGTASDSMHDCASDSVRITFAMRLEVAGAVGILEAAVPLAHLNGEAGLELGATDCRFAVAVMFGGSSGRKHLSRAGGVVGSQTRRGVRPVDRRAGTESGSTNVLTEAAMCPGRLGRTLGARPHVSDCDLRVRCDLTMVPPTSGIVAGDRPAAGDLLLAFSYAFGEAWSGQLNCYFNVGGMRQTFIIGFAFAAQCLDRRGVKGSFRTQRSSRLSPVTAHYTSGFSTNAVGLKVVSLACILITGYLLAPLFGYGSSWVGAILGSTNSSFLTIQGCLATVTFLTCFTSPGVCLSRMLYASLRVVADWFLLTSTAPSPRKCFGIAISANAFGPKARTWASAHPQICICLPCSATSAIGIPLTIVSVRLRIRGGP